MNKQKCYLCDQQIAEVSSSAEENINVVVSCENCGKYIINYDALQTLQTDFKDKRYILSGLIREHTEEHLPTLEINRFMLNNLISYVGIPSDLFEMLDKILMYIYKKSSYSGEPIELMDFEFAIAHAKNIEEFRFLLAKLKDLNYIEMTEKDKYILSLEGWKRISEIRKIIRKSDQCFIAMWFPKDKSMEPFEAGAKLALEKTGYIPFIVKDVEHNDKICDKIVAEIRKSAFMIADFTEYRRNVYFEAGFAMGLGIPVIFTCKNTYFEKIKEQIDTRQYPHIEWTDSEDLEKKLVNRIEATISI